MPIARDAPAQNGGVCCEAPWWRLEGGNLEGWIMWSGGDRGPTCQLITHRDSQVLALPENPLPPAPHTPWGAAS